MISLIIPTHNRAAQLQECLESINALSEETQFEVVVVLNNCTDNSLEIASSFSKVRAVSEPATAFSRARDVGAENASGDILVFMDDDALLRPGTLKRIDRIMRDNLDCGVIAGKIDAAYESNPPKWVKALQQSHNGLSLWSPVESDHLDSVYEVAGACGPLMAVRADLYRRVGGFPPDTLGVETNLGSKVFSKIYVGPGDYGLVESIKATSAKVLFCPGVAVWHVVSEFRLTTGFWASRYFGEGCYLAIADQKHWRVSRSARLYKILRASAIVTVAGIQHRTWGFRNSRPFIDSLKASDLWVLESIAYLSVGVLLVKNDSLGSSLWQAAKMGVTDDEFDTFVANLPPIFIGLVSLNWAELVRSRTPVDALVQLGGIREYLGLLGFLRLVRLFLVRVGPQPE